MTGRKRIRLPLEQLGYAHQEIDADLDGELSRWGWRCGLCSKRPVGSYLDKESAEDGLVSHLSIEHDAHGGDQRRPCRRESPRPITRGAALHAGSNRR